MINKISGKLEEINEGNISINCSGISYSISVPGGFLENLKSSKKIGDEVSLYTIYYIENGVGGSALHPKLIGFSCNVEREFFEKYTTVKGLGIKSALKSLVISVKNLARAIENGDISVIKKLPGIGARTAEKIIAELKGRVAKYALLKEFADEIQKEPKQNEEGVPDKSDIDYMKKNQIEEETNQILSELGYTKLETAELLKKVYLKNIKFENTEQVIQEIFKQSKNFIKR
ncbi:MAG TPA: OB-fold domain-containing protein [bacterium]|nr:OB-fold domain-containing protein [bacterium]HPN31913.1 OB-fold domain-containing protein [bacterium]